jgi:hypothetical protein
MIWTIATSCCVVLVFSVGQARASWRSRDPLATLLAAFSLAMAAFASVVALPMHNSMKFVFELFVPGVVLAAPRFAATVSSQWHRRRIVTAIALVLIFGVPTALTLHGYLVDPTGRTRLELNPLPGEEAMYQWMRTETPSNAVMVDRAFREIVMVKGRRRLYLGTEQPADLAAFPAQEMARRHRVMLDLYGPFAEPAADLAALRDLGRPVYVLFRPQDANVVPDLWQRLATAAPGSEVAYDRDGFRVLRLATGGPS